ncbi:MAG: tetratricopeptide repeat protein, partial [Nitrospinae bacterium]|nr:tetratricopeptide repeat protein [Nitrospinota bacterium]
MGGREKLMAVYLEVIRSWPDQTAWTQRAVEKALELAVVPGDVDASTRNLTELAHEQAGLPELAAAALIRAGNLREGASDILAARALYREAARRAADARGRGEALFALAQSHAAQEEFEQALAVYREIERDTGPREEAYARARRESARQRLRLARFELARGEAAIALKTYASLLAEDADMAAAHRGRVEALAALGRAKESVAVYEKETTPAGRYALGLALTYLAPPDLARARGAVEEAVRANPGEPWFHQTLGWIYEQLERGESAEGFAERALMEYELALSLLEADAPAERRADLYTNLGNVHYLLNDCPDAVARYRDRLATGLPFPVRAQESVVHQRLGECAYRLGDDRAAAGWFRRALELSGEGEAARRVELYERMGLALQSAGEWAGAAESFTRALEPRRSAGLAADTAVTLRNIANNLHQGAAAGGPEARENLYRALALYQLSAGELARSGKSAAVKEKHGALISVEVETGVGGAQLAARGFGEREERRLIHHQMGDIHSQLGDWAKAAEHFGQKLAASPDEPRLLANPAALMERAVAYNQLAFALAKSGQGARAREAYARALELCHKTQSAVCLAENAASLAALALAGGDGAGGAVELAAPALEAARALGGADRLTMGLGWARLGALYMERALAPDTGGKDAVRNARALRALGDGLYHAAKSLELARREFAASPGTVSARADIKTVMRQGLLAQALGEAEQSAGLFEQAAALAEARLAPDLAWQARALALIAGGGGSPENVARQIAAAPLAMLEDGDARFAHALAAEVYGRLAARALEQGDAAAALAHIDEGMAARLRMSLGGLLALEGGGVPDLGALAELEKARATLAAEAAAGGKDIAARWTEWGKQYARAAEAAAGENPALGRLILPLPLDMVELQGYLDEGEALVTILHSPAALIVVTAEGVRAAPAAGGIADALAKAAPGARRIYLATDRPFSDPAADELAARYEVAVAPAPRLLPLFKEAQTINDFRLLAFGFETAAWNPAHFGEVTASRGLEAARRIDGGLLSSPGVAAFARGPVIGGAGELPRLSLGVENGAAVWQSIGALVEANAGGAALITPPPVGPDGARAAPGPGEGAALSLALLSGYATWVITPDEQGARDVFIEAFTGGLDSGSLGESFAAARRGSPGAGRLLGAFGLDAGARAEFARERFAELARAGARSIERGEHGKAARELSDALWYTRLAGISRYDEPILNRLAETEYRLGRYEEALAHQERLTKIHEAAGDTLKLAESLTLSGAMRNRLGRYGESARDYERALALYQKLGQPGRMARALAGLGVAEEERQRYGEALSAFGRARELASRAGERDEAALGHGRIGRIHHLRQNDYARAREAYEAGLKLAEPGGAAWLELSFGLGAVETDAGRLERAAEIFKEALARARAAKNMEAAGRAEFHLGSVHWFRGEYGEAFSLLRSAQNRARAGGDVAPQAMIANTLGLVYWTLNDYPRALDALAASRELAKKAAAPLDEASALNNLGLVHRSMGEWDTALSFFEQARDLDLRLGSDWGLGYDARNMSIAWLLKGELDRAEEAAREAVEITGRIHDRINHAKALLQLAETQAARGSWNKAGARYEEAVKAAEEVWSPETLWRALRGRGLARQAGGD